MFVEVKQNGKRLTQEQYDFMAQVVSRGAVAYLAVGTGRGAEYTMHTMSGIPAENMPAKGKR